MNTLRDLYSEKLSDCCGAELITEANDCGICSECREWSTVLEEDKDAEAVNKLIEDKE